MIVADRDAVPIVRLSSFYLFSYAALGVITSFPHSWRQWLLCFFALNLPLLRAHRG